MDSAIRTRTPAKNGISGFDILSQPDETTCGPTCLQAVYNYYQDRVPLDRVIVEVPRLKQGGTLAVHLGCHALNRGYQTTIYTYNLNIFDPTWFPLTPPEMEENLLSQLEFKKQSKLRIATLAYIEYLKKGGRIRFRDLTGSLIRRYLKQGIPIITGLSATYLYQSPREYGDNCDYDDIRGEPTGHFVVLCGYDRQKYTVRIADPLIPNPYGINSKYEVSMPRLICSILLGVLTYDAKLLVIEPARKKMPLRP